MKRFEELTRLGRIRRCKKIIEEGLVFYDLKIKSLSFLEEATNIFYKLVDENNNKYAIKIYQELSSNLDDALTEIYFLNEIASHTDIIVPKAYASKTGEFVTVIESQYDTIPKRMAVYEWMDGKDIDEKEEIEHFEKIGAMMATMHQYSKSLQVPAHIKAKKIDKVLYFAGDDYYYKMPKHQDKINSRYIKLMDFVIPYLDKRLIKLYDEDTYLIHGDMNPFNIKYHKDEIRLLDFEDTAMATATHDIGIFLFYYQYEKNYESYKEAFLKSYRSIQDVDIKEDDIELVMIARHVNFLNYVLEVNDEPSKYIERNVTRVEKYLSRVCPEYFES